MAKKQPQSTTAQTPLGLNLEATTRGGDTLEQEVQEWFPVSGITIGGELISSVTMVTGKGKYAIACTMNGAEVSALLSRDLQRSYEVGQKIPPHRLEGGLLSSGKLFLRRRKG